MTEATGDSTNVITVETRIAASPETVWRALTENIDEWWKGYGGGEEGRRSFHLDARPGGKMYEQYDDGGGLLWGTVCTVMPQAKLQVVGHNFPEWGGPNLWFGTWQLEAADDGCRLRFTEHSIGEISDIWQARHQEGWSYLFDGVLKAHLEGRPLPEFESAVDA